MWRAAMTLYSKPDATPEEREAMLKNYKRYRELVGEAITPNWWDVKRSRNFLYRLRKFWWTRVLGRPWLHGWQVFDNVGGVAVYRREVTEEEAEKLLECLGISGKEKRWETGC